MPEQSRRDKGEGSFFQRADGKWVGIVELPPHADGRRRRKQVVRRSRREAEQALKSMRVDKMRAGGDLRTNAPKVGDWVRDWIDQRERSGHLRPRTAQTYRGYLDRHIAPHLGRTRVDKLTPVQIERMTAAMIAGGTSPTSALQAHNILKGALKDAERKGLADRNVAALAEAPRTAHHEADVLPLNEARTLLDWAALQDPMTHARITLALLTGMRQAEVLGLTRSAVDMESGAIVVRWQLQSLKSPPPLSLAFHHLGGPHYLTEPKSKAGVRVVPIVGRLRRALERRLAEMPEDPWALFITAPKGGPLDASKDRRQWVAALDGAGVRHIRLHDARHTTATLMRAAGIETRLRQRLLGHSSAPMAEHYAHELDGELGAAMTVFGETFDL